MAGSGFVEINKRDHLLLKDYIRAFDAAKFEYSKLYIDDDRSLHILDLFDNFINDYYKENTEIILFSDEELEEYRYRPIALSNALYGTPDMWRVLLKCNEMIHPGEMELVKEFKAPKRDKLLEFFNKYEIFMDNLGGLWEDLKEADYSIL